MITISNPQWMFLKGHLDKGQDTFSAAYYNIRPNTLQSLEKKGALKHLGHRRYQITQEGKKAVANMNRLTERYDRE